MQHIRGEWQGLEGALSAPVGVLSPPECYRVMLAFSGTELVSCASVAAHRACPTDLQASRM
jgi:hypothetical protein